MEKYIKKVSIILILSMLCTILISLTNCNLYAVNQIISSDVNSIDDSIYPGIKEKINLLKSKYKKWNFKILYTGLDWNDVIANEYTGHGASPRNLVYKQDNYRGAWICNICGQKDYDNGNWHCSSEVAIKYMMDPRNSLNEFDIFQFEELTNNGYDLNVIKSMIKGTFLESHENGIATAGQENNINPYYIIARLIQEQGKYGSALTNGTNGYYNPFNIAASGNSTSQIISNGLEYAKRQGWTTLDAGINGGIKFLSKEYIKRGQNTLYLQKFDVDNSDGGLYWHQYMQNILAAQNEGTTLRNTYNNINALESSHTFIIPVYKNMPSTSCDRPDGNNNIPVVTTDIVKVNVNSVINLRSSPNGNVIGNLYKGEIVTRIEKATQRQGKTYWDKIRKSDGTEGYVARETDYDESTYKLYLVSVNEGNNSNINNNNTSKGDVNGDGNISASDYVIIKNYIMGVVSLTNSQKDVADVNKDGLVNASDYVMIKNHIMGLININ